MEDRQLRTYPIMQPDRTDEVSTRFKQMEEFTKLLNTEPPQSSIKKTPDDKAEEIPISYIEAKLDEVYLRQWGTRNVRLQQLGNEIMVWLDLWVIDPQTGREITRSGFAAIQITVDAVPARLKWKDGESEENRKERNGWALDMSNKKSNALQLAFPKAKSLAIKNASKTLGAIFGRNLNRKFEDTPGDFYGNLENDMATLTDAKKDIEAAAELPAFEAIWALYPELHANVEFQKHYTFYHMQLKRKLKQQADGK